MPEIINPLNLQNIPNSISVSWPTPGDYNYAPVTRDAIQVIINNIQKNKNDINTIDESIATLNTNVASLSGSVTILNTNVASLSGSVTILNTNVASLSGSIATFNTSVTSLSGSVTSLSGSVTILNTNVASLSGSVNNLSESINTIFQNITTINIKIDEISAALNSLNPGSCNIPINTINLNSNLIAYDFMQYTLEEQSGPLDGGFGWETPWIFNSSVVTQPLSNSFGGFQIGPNISGLGDVVLRGNGFNPIVRKLNTTLQDFWFLCAFNISLAGDWQWVIDFGFFPSTEEFNISAFTIDDGPDHIKQGNIYYTYRLQKITTGVENKPNLVFRTVDMPSTSSGTFFDVIFDNETGIPENMGSHDANSYVLLIEFKLSESNNNRKISVRIYDDINNTSSPPVNPLNVGGYERLAEYPAGSGQQGLNTLISMNPSKNFDKINFIGIRGTIFIDEIRIASSYESLFFNDNNINSTKYLLNNPNPFLHFNQQNLLSLATIKSHSNFYNNGSLFFARDVDDPNISNLYVKINNKFYKINMTEVLE